MTDTELTVNQRLIKASSKADANAVKALIDEGADVHAMEDWSIRSASEQGHAEVVKVLIEAGADVRAQSGQWESTSLARMS